jgi:hypothetical protein
MWEAHRYLGNKELTHLEKRVGFFFIGAIMKTGDGTRQHPYLVARISDEYDVLFALGKERGTQKLCSEKDRFLDVQICLDGTQVCFDVTDPYLNQ